MFVCICNAKRLHIFEYIKKSNFLVRKYKSVLYIIHTFLLTLVPQPSGNCHNWHYNMLMFKKTKQSNNLQHTKTFLTHIYAKVVLPRTLPLNDMYTTTNILCQPIAWRGEYFELSPNTISKYILYICNGIFTLEMLECKQIQPWH